MADGPFSIDIAVCTRDRLSSLRETIAALQEAAADVSGVRFLIVDNNSSDGTGAFLADLAAADSRVTAIHEPLSGIYHARLAAIRHCRGDVLLFVDDDVVPAPDFLTPLRRAFADPTVGVVGAAIEGAPRGNPPPSWFPERLRADLPILPVRGERETCSYPRFPPGACLALRRHPCLGHYFAPERRRVVLGSGGGAPGGYSMVYGDDTDLCEIYARAGFKIIRLASVRVGHRIHADRITPEWVIAKYRRDGRLRVRLARLRGKPAVGRETLTMLAAMPALVLVNAVAPLLGTTRRSLARAYLAKSLGAWIEVLAGPRGVRFPYPPEPPAETPRGC